MQASTIRIDCWRYSLARTLGLESMTAYHAAINELEDILLGYKCLLCIYARRLYCFDVHIHVLICMCVRMERDR